MHVHVHDIPVDLGFLLCDGCVLEVCLFVLLLVITCQWQCEWNRNTKNNKKNSKSHFKDSRSNRESLLAAFSCCHGNTCIIKIHTFI